MSILVTGGAGYIGSHTCLELLRAGYEVVVIDNLCNSCEESLKRVEILSQKKIRFYPYAVEDKEKLREVFEKETIEAVIHFAGLKAVGESVEKPLMYYKNNLFSTLTLCEVMKEYQVNKLVFSSSATVYGDPEVIPIPETAHLSVTNPYGRTKLMQEEILTDLALADQNLSVILLRYFNPIGADESGQIGEDPNGIPNNLTPYITQVMVGKLPFVRIFGDDYDTIDGTGVRDYIHVTDLAKGHVLSVKKLLSMTNGVNIYNLGTGQGYSVLQMIHAFERVSGKEIPYEICKRRAGDIATCYADPSVAKKELGFVAEKTLEQMCQDAYRWQTQNPNGYQLESSCK